ncbi:MAG TPA: c-type cytochrome [Candidatus Acidoferrales bacterium]|nr:c-type cytochrome [Candidatus Acidoferrales bacterium]
MQTRFVALLLAVIALAVTGCENRSATEGDTSPINPTYAAVGPIPGTNQPNPIGPTSPYINDAVGLQEGRRLFVWYNCYGCHGGHGGGGMGPSLRDQDWIYGATDADIFNSIAQGRAHGMPAWGTRIPQDQVWKIVAYIKSLNTSREPDPPR